MAKKTLQQKIDNLVAKHGAVLVIEAIKNHIHPDGGTTCPETPCGNGYYCSGGVCKLNVGP